VGADSNHIILGDNGQVDYNAAGLVTSYQTTDTLATTGGADVIVTGDGANTILGGVGGDQITTGNGLDTILGDNGIVQLNPAGTQFVVIYSNVYLSGSTTALDLIGGNDVIDAGQGNNIVIGGFGGDSVTTGAGDDIAFGDNGYIGYTNGVATTLTSIDTVADTAGDDIMALGDGTNLVVAGAGSDSVTTGNGSDIVFGDNATITNNPDGSVQVAVSGDPLLGGNDTISTGDGNDLAAGGAGADTVTSAGGNDILFGDGGQVTYGAGGQLQQIVSVDENFGGSDLIDGGAGNDVLIGGQGSDQMAGNLTEDLLFGGNAAVVIAGGFVQSIESDMQDLVTAALYESFNALGGSDDQDGTTVVTLQSLPGNVVIIPGVLPGAAPKLVPLLDASVFRKLFQSEVVTTVNSPSHSGATESGAAEQGGAQGSSTEQGDGGPQDGTPGPQQQGSPAEEQVPTGLLLPPLETLARVDSPRAVRVELGSDEHAEAAPVLALGAAGLLASNRGLLDRDAMAGTAANGKRPLTRRALDAITRKWFGGSAAQVPAQAPAEHRDSDRPAPGARQSRIEW